LGVAEIAALWLADVEREIDPGTVDTLMVYVRHFERFFGAFGQITDAACARYARERLGQVKRPTVQKELSALRRFVGWCEEQGFLTRAPRVPPPAKRATGTAYKIRRRSKPTPLSPEEALAVIDALPDWSASKKVDHFPVRARFRFAFETALRPKTIDQLSVPENYVRGSSMLVITDEIDKVRFGRELPLTVAAQAAIDSVCPEKGIIFGKHDYRDQLDKAAAAALTPEKARTFTGYDLRHARATQWAESGNLVGVAYLLGHKQVTTTNRYARPNRAAAEKVIRIIKDSAKPRWLRAPSQTMRAAA
jgi:integrase